MVIGTSVENDKNHINYPVLGDPTMKTDKAFSSVEDFVVDGDDGDQGLGFLSSVDEIPSATTGAGQESDRYYELFFNELHLKHIYTCVYLVLKCKFLATLRRKVIRW